MCACIMGAVCGGGGGGGGGGCMLSLAPARPDRETGASARVPSHRTTPTTLRDPAAHQEPFCRVLLGVLAAFIRQFLQCTVSVRAPRTLIEDVATMMHAKAFVSGISSLGLFVGAARAGPTYLPVTEQGARGHAPCISHIRWYKIRPYMRIEEKGRARHNVSIGQIRRWFAPEQEGLVTRVVASVQAREGLGT